MICSVRNAWFSATVLTIAASSLDAQSGATQQDPTLDNLSHPAGYRSAPLGQLGAVVRRGTGPVDVLIIPGWGFGADDFDRFMRDNESRYRMVAVTLPGFSGTPAPPMPPAGTSYGANTWTRAAQDAITRLIVAEKLDRPVVVAHFIVATQIAVRLAAERPDLVGGIVVVGGEPMRFQQSRRPATKGQSMSLDERIGGIDSILAPRWFKTVTMQTWIANNYRAPQYARDSSRAERLWQKSTATPLPVMVRYLTEYYASDLRDDFARLAVPTRVLVPGFSAEILSDSAQSYVKSLFIDSWETLRAVAPRIQIVPVPHSRIFVTEDRPEAVRDAIDATVRDRASGR